MRHLAILAKFCLSSGNNLSEMFCTDYRILEEASCTAHNRRLRQFLLSCPDDYLTNERRRHFCSSRFRGCLHYSVLDMSVIQLWLRRTRKRKHNMGHYESALDLRILEDRVTITIFAFADIKLHELLFFYVIAIDGMYNILYLNAICADVLNCRSTNLTWNIREILNSPQSFLGSPIAEVIKDDTCSHRNEHLR